MNLVKRISNFVVILSSLGVVMLFVLSLTHSLVDFDLVAKSDSPLKSFLNLETFNRLGFYALGLMMLIILYTHFLAISGLKENLDIANFLVIAILLFYVLISPLAIFLFVLGFYGPVGIQGIGENALPLSEILANLNSREIVKDLIIRSLGIYTCLTLLGLGTRLFFMKDIERYRNFLKLKTIRQSITKQVAEGKPAKRTPSIAEIKEMTSLEIQKEFLN